MSLRASAQISRPVRQIPPGQRRPARNTLAALPDSPLRLLPVSAAGIGPVAPHGRALPGQRAAVAALTTLTGTTPGLRPGTTHEPPPASPRTFTPSRRVRRELEDRSSVSGPDSGAYRNSAPTTGAHAS